MSIDFAPLRSTPRLLIEASLAPLQGTRFQPTGFPNLGAATYDGPGGERMLLVESAQSMANRLEVVCWDKVRDDWVAPLTGLPLTKVRDSNGKPITNSVLESHRLNSEYIARTEDFKKLAEQIGYRPDRAFDVQRQLVPFLLRYDINSLIHGIFLEEVAGVMRLPRSLSAFIEARNVTSAMSGGVKFNAVNPGLKDGEGNVPYSREEFVSSEITAYFSIDCAQIRAFGLGQATEDLLIALCLFKIQAFLEQGLRLRTACDLQLAATGPVIRRPAGFVLPSLNQIETLLPTLISLVAAEHHWPVDRVSWVTHLGTEKPKRGQKGASAAEESVA